MIDINKLRRLAQAAMTGPDGVSLNWVKLLQDFQKEANPAAVSELLDRLEAAEKDIALKERIIDSLGSELYAVANERDELRAKVAEMEQQEPVAWMLNCPTLGGDTGWILSWTQSGAGLCNRLSGEENEKKLYLAPGAKGE